MKLSPKQKLFVNEYLVDLNASAAALRAGYSPKSAGTIGYENLKKPQIQQALEIRRAELIEEGGGKIATPEEVLEGYTRDMRFDPGQLFDKNDKPIPIGKLPEELRLSLCSHRILETIKETEDATGKQEIILKRTIEVRYPDKTRVRDSFMKAIGYVNGDIENATQNIQIIINPEPLRKALES